MLDELRRKARELLEKGDAEVIIGYGRGSRDDVATPVFITNAARVDELIFNPYCHNNLMTFITRDDHKRLGRPAVVAKECDMKAAIVLVQEDQVGEDALLLLSVSCEEMGRADASCTFNGVMTVPEAGEWLRENYLSGELGAEKLARVEEIEKMGARERWDFWSAEFERCIRCYACRQACPLCYCSQCIAEKNQPQWLSTSAHPVGNMAWNVVRAFHLAGRCVDCGECERACPVDIPLSTLNRAIQKDVREAFDYISGYDHAGKPVMATFRKDDDEQFFM